MSLEKLQSDVKESLTKHRYEHVKGVAQTAVTLASVHGVSAVDAEMAAWLHDLAREWPRDKLLATAETVWVPDGFKEVPALLHGPIAAHIGRETYGIDHAEILDAVTYHTTGRPLMTPLDLILFVADAIEPNRAYDGVEDMRAVANANLREAALQSIDSTIRHLLNRRRPLFPLTVATRNDLLKNL